MLVFYGYILIPFPYEADICMEIAKELAKFDVLSAEDYYENNLNLIEVEPLNE